MLSYQDAMSPSTQYQRPDEYMPMVDEQPPYARAPMMGPHTDYSYLGTPSPRPTVESPYLNVNFPHQVAIEQPDPLCNQFIDVGTERSRKIPPFPLERCQTFFGCAPRLRRHKHHRWQQRCQHERADSAERAQRQLRQQRQLRS